MFGKAPMDDEDMDEEDEGSGDSEFDAEASTALDSEAPMGERMRALKEAIRLCRDPDYKDEKPKKGSGPDIALLLAPKGKR
jgi:hypothetical protein